MILPQAIRRELARVADPTRATGAQAYMKSEMPFLGVGAVPLRRVCRQIFEAHPLATPTAWKRTVLSIWRNAEFREERYAAIELTGAKRYRDFQTLDTLPMYEEIIVTGAWWDYVDAVAVHRIGQFLLRDFPKPMKKEMMRWRRDQNLWKRRSSILSQITFKKETDLDLLYACIEPSLSSREFFLRKAIGWALRQYGWTDPEEVVRYVKAHQKQLSPLSRREALKSLDAATRRRGEARTTVSPQ